MFWIVTWLILPEVICLSQRLRRAKCSMTGDDWESIHIRCGHRPCKSKVVLIDVNLAKRTFNITGSIIFLKRVCVCIRFHIIRWSKEVCFVEQIWHGLASGPRMLQLHNFIQYFCAYRIYHANRDIFLREIKNKCTLPRNTSDSSDGAHVDFSSNTR